MKPKIVVRRTQQWLVGLIVFCAPFSTVWLISRGQQLGPVDNAFFHVTIYPLEFLMLAVGALWLYRPKRNQVIRLAPLLGCAALAALSALWAREPELALSAAFHILAATVFAGALAAQLRDRKTARALFKVFLASIVLQALWGGAQTFLGHDLGLRFLGESSLSTTMLGVAKVAGGADVVLRAYGSLPHPNILAGYFLTGLILGTAILLSRPKVSSAARVGLAFSLGIIGSGLILTYSRSALLVTGLGLAALGVYALKLRPAFPKELIITFALLAVTTTLVLGVLLQRSDFNSAKETGIDNRAVGISFALSSTLQNPLGVGAGNAVPAISDERPDLPYYQHQPPHIALLLIALELGWLGFAAILYFIGKTAKDFHALRIISPGERIQHFSLVILAGALTALSFADHFLWSLPQGLWLVAGFVAIVLSRLDASEDRA